MGNSGEGTSNSLNENCDNCGKSFRPFPFFIKSCNNCGSKICFNCWKQDADTSVCPKCGHVLSQLDNERTITYLLRQLSGGDSVKVSIKPDLAKLAQEIKSKIFFDEMSMEVSFLGILSSNELKSVLMLFTSGDDKKNVIKLYQKTRKKSDDSKGQQLDLDMTCIPICHFNR